MGRENFGYFEPKIAADFVAQFEGFRESAYLCPSGVLTIGYGHTNGVKHLDVIDRDQAKKLLIADLELTAKGLLKYVNARITANQYIAILSFAFNVGTGAVLRSTFLKKLNSGDEEGAADELLKWTKSKGKTLQGLVNRRRAERDLFLTGI